MAPYIKTMLAAEAAFAAAYLRWEEDPENLSLIMVKDMMEAALGDAYLLVMEVNKIERGI